MKKYNNVSIVFFGSTSDSVIVLDKLFTYATIQQSNNITISSVVTQPPSPIGRKQIITPTPVELWAKNHNIPVVSFPTDERKPWLYKNQDNVIHALSTFKPDLLISASYGQKIPQPVIRTARYGGLNVHPSLLPRWRGADPVPWTILSGDRQTGVTIVTIMDKFDQGKIISQKKILISETDLTNPLRTKLFTYGADLLISSLPDYISGKNKGEEQNLENATYARRFTRDDGFIPWDHIQAAIEGNDIPKKKRVGIPQLVMPVLGNVEGGHLSFVISRMTRALSPWPGVWTRLASTPQRESRRANTEGERLKILEAHAENEKLILDVVQLEGKNPVLWKQFKKSYL